MAAGFLLVVLILTTEFHVGSMTSYIKRYVNHDELINVKNCQLYGTLSNSCNCPYGSSFYNIPNKNNGTEYCYGGIGTGKSQSSILWLEHNI